MILGCIKMNLPKELILVIFKKDLAKLVCLNKEFNELFKDVLKPVTEVKVGKIHSLYGYYKISDKCKPDTYCFNLRKEFYLSTNDSLNKFKDRFSIQNLLAMFSDGIDIRDLFRLSSPSHPILKHKEIELVYFGSYKGNALVYITAFNDVIIGDFMNTHVYKPKSPLTRRQKMVLTVVENLYL